MFLESIVKKRIKKIIAIIFGIIVSPFVIILLLFGLLLLTTPISRPNASVEKYVLKKIPIGTSMDDVIEITENHKKWKVEQISLKGGLRKSQITGNVLFADPEEEYENYIDVIGEKSMLIYLGEYYGPLHTAVLAYLAFDENDKLIKVAIRRDIDGL